MQRILSIQQVLRQPENTALVHTLLADEAVTLRVLACHFNVEPGVFF